MIFFESLSSAGRRLRSQTALTFEHGIELTDYFIFCITTLLYWSAQTIPSFQPAHISKLDNRSRQSLPCRHISEFQLPCPGYLLVRATVVLEHRGLDHRRGCCHPWSVTQPCHLRLRGLLEFDGQWECLEIIIIIIKVEAVRHG